MPRLKSKIYFCFAFLFLGLAANAKVRPPPSKDEVLAKYTYEELQSAANYLASRAAYPHQKILKCDISVKKSQIILSGSLRSLIDEKRKVFEANYRSNQNSLQSQITNCAATCQCSAYYAALDEIDTDLQANEIHQKIFTQLKLEITKQTQKKELSCSMKLAWFCGSKLFSYLSQ